MAKQNKPTAFSIVNLLHLVIPEDLAEGYEVAPGIWLTNNKKFIRTLLSHNLKKMIGEIEYRTLTESKAAIYSFADIDLTPLTSEGQTALLNAYLITCRALTYAMWFIKDNSVAFELGFIEAPHLRTNPRVTSNFLSEVPTASSVQSKEVEFSVDELERVAHIFQEYYVKIFYDELKPIDLDKVNRLQRVAYFLQAASGSVDMIVAIAE